MNELFAIGDWRVGVDERDDEFCAFKLEPMFEPRFEFRLELRLELSAELRLDCSVEFNVEFRFEFRLLPFSRGFRSKKLKSLFAAILFACCWLIRLACRLVVGETGLWFTDFELFDRLRLDGLPRILPVDILR